MYIHFEERIKKYNSGFQTFFVRGALRKLIQYSRRLNEAKICKF